MKCVTKLLIFGIVCASIGIFVVAGWAVYPPPSGIQAGAVVADEVIVKFKAGVPAANIRAAHAKFQAKIALTIAGLGAQVVKLPAKKSRAELNAIVTQYKQDPNVEYAEVNGIMTIQRQVSLPPEALEVLKLCIIQPGGFPSDDPHFAQLWGIMKIRGNCAWDTNIGAGNITVAVVDTGVDYTHEDLAGTVRKGYDFVNDDTDAMDDQGHGTHVAGTIAATLNNNKGVVGVSPNVRILAVKVLDSYGSGSWSTVASGVVYAADKQARVINLSLGGSESTQTVKDAVNYAWKKGVLLACAAGNDGAGDPGYPAAYKNCLAVAATDQNDERASFSQYAPDGVAAPGVSILSSLPGNNYESWSGTSMATPHVAGLAALLFSQNPNRTNRRVREIIQGTTDDIGTAGKDPIFGYGRINASKAVHYQCAASSCP